MKILIVGSKKVWAIENLYNKYFNQNDVVSEIYPIHDLFYDFYYMNIFNKFLFRISSSFIYKKLNDDFLKFISSNGFDVVWVFKGMEVFPETLAAIKPKGIKLVNYNPDHPFYFSGLGSGNSNVLNSIRQYDLHLCYHSLVMRRIQQEYNVPCKYLPFGYEPTSVTLPTEGEEIMKACFVGNPDKIRISYVQMLIDVGIPIDLFGNNWHKFIKPGKNTGIFPAIYKDEFASVAPLYRLQINIFRTHNEGSHNMRTFEMPGLGCIMVTPESDEQNLFFKDESQVFFYASKHELILKLKKILSLSYEEACLIKKNAIQRSIEDGYSYKERAKKVIKSFEELVVE